FRKIGVNGIPQLLRVFIRGNTECIDGEYLYYDGDNMQTLYYSVTAKYNFTNQYSDHTWLICSGGDSGLPALWKEEKNSSAYVITEYSVSNYPNPFNPSTNINYQLKETGHVTIRVYDMLGREVAELVNEVKDIGIYSVEFDGSDLTSGVYLYTIRADALSEGNRGYTASKEILLIK
ncbi:MAG: T9SS type A sorting domain-containing protein, partial [Melioribacteraceae bacterium]|nr:T9SS type A sorting domain-containing protein [Melioribacteraceae bacterium]